MMDEYIICSSVVYIIKFGTIFIFIFRLNKSLVAFFLLLIFIRICRENNIIDYVLKFLIILELYIFLF
jgi:hypothetical protein